MLKIERVKPFLYVFLEILRWAHQRKYFLNDMFMIVDNLVESIGTEIIPSFQIEELTK